MVKIAVIFPSRGLAFSETIEELLVNLKGYEHQIFFSHSNPIPDCFNKPLAQAFSAGGFSHVWFVEEDMVLPPDILKHLLAQDYPAVSCNYPISKEPSYTILKDPFGNAYWSGTGCLLVDFDLMKKVHPLRANIIWSFEHTEAGTVFHARRPEGRLYGQHDINLGLQLYQRYPIKLLDTTLGQRRLMKRGGRESNDGIDVIEVWDQALDNPFPANLYQRADESLIDEYLLDGNIVRLSKLSPLVSSGKAQKVHFRTGAAIYDFSACPDLVEGFMWSV